MKKPWNPNKKINFIVVVWAVLFSYIVTNLVLSPQLQQERLLAAGQIYEVRHASLTKSSATWIYDEQQELYTIVGDDAKKSYGKWNEAVDWKCLYLKLDKLNRDSVGWVFKAYDAEKNVVGQQIISLHNGENWIAMDINVPFQSFSIQILGAQGLQFQIEKMILLEEVPQKKLGILLFAAILLLIMLGYMLIQKKSTAGKERGRYLRKLGDFQQFCCALLGNGICFSIGRKLTSQKKNRVRTALFACLFLYMIWVYDANCYISNSCYRYHCLVVAAVLLLVTVISKEQRLVAGKNYSKTACWWYAFWTIACISDFIVSKRLKFTGWMMLAVVGLFCMVWRQMQQPQQIWWNMLHAVEIIAAAGVIYNIICRPKYDGLLYNGYMTSAADFAMFSGFVWMLFLIDIYQCLRDKAFGRRMIFCVCGAAVSALQILLSGKVIVILFAAVFGVFILVAAAADKQKLLNFSRKQFLLYMGLAVVVVVIYYLGVKKLPWILGTFVQYTKERYETNKDASVIAILAQSGNEVYQKVECQSIKEQLLIWKSYLWEINLFGHKLPNMKIWNKQYNAGNHVLQILYRYGIFAVLPYVMLFVTAAKQQIENCRKHWKNLQMEEVLSVGVLGFFVLVGCFGNLEYPYYQPAWLFVYLLIGKYLVSS